MPQHEMIDPKSGYNKVRVQEWSDSFWGSTIYLWLPLLVLWKLIGFYRKK